MSETKREPGSVRKRRLQVLDVLRERGTMSEGQLVLRCLMAAAQVRGVLRRLESDGRIERTADGYRLRDHMR